MTWHWGRHDPCPQGILASWENRQTSKADKLVKANRFLRRLLEKRRLAFLWDKGRGTVQYALPLLGWSVDNHSTGITWDLFPEAGSLPRPRTHQNLHWNNSQVVHMLHVQVCSEEKGFPSHKSTALPASQPGDVAASLQTDAPDPHHEDRTSTNLLGAEEQVLLGEADQEEGVQSFEVLRA